MDFAKLDRAFNPECIVVVGDMRQWLGSLNKFRGRLYSVQINAKSIEATRAKGIQSYTSLLDVPGPIDLVIVATPRETTPKILEDCISKEVAAAHFFTAGFSETGTEKGKKLESLLVSRAKQANFNLIGPNCQGVYCPENGLRFSSAGLGLEGSIGLISQSGVQLLTMAGHAYLEGVGIHKAVSYGNGTVLDSTDFLEYFGGDAGVKVIGIYVEGVRDGKRFLSVLRQVAARKPVVVWKGGRTREGGRATASHSASLAIPHRIWEAAMRQCGAISVSNFEEFMDSLKALVSLPPVHGNSVGLLAGSGGRAVALTDSFVEAGFRVPLLTQESNEELATFFNAVGGSYYNPVDMGTNQLEYVRVLEILERDPNIDNLVLLMWLWGIRLGSGQLETEIPALIDIRRRTSKPLIVVLSYLDTPQNQKLAAKTVEGLQKGCIPTFPTAERAARALKNILDYSTWQQARSLHE